MMENFYFSSNCFDGLGKEKFDSMVYEILTREFKDGDFYIGPSKGKDGGIDAKFLKSEKKERAIQIKWREIIRQPLSKHRSQALKDFNNWVGAMLKNKNIGKCLFITNVPLSIKYSNLFQETIRMNKSLHIQYWSFEELKNLLNKHSDLYYKYIEQLPNNLKAERDELKKVVDELQSKKLIKKDSYPALKIIEQKFQQLFISIELKKKYYFAFLYLLSPVYKGGRDKIKRGKLRRLFRITEKEEEIFISELFRENLIEITGDLITIKDENDAKKILNEAIDNTKVDLDKIVNLFFE